MKTIADEQTPEGDLPYLEPLDMPHWELSDEARRDIEEMERHVCRVFAASLGVKP